MEVKWNTLWNGASKKSGKVEISGESLDELAEAIGQQAKLNPGERLVIEFENKAGKKRDLRIARMNPDSSARGMPADWHYYW